MTMFEYEGRFYELSHCAMYSVPTKCEKVHRLMKGFISYL